MPRHRMLGFQPAEGEELMPYALTKSLSVAIGVRTYKGGDKMNIRDISTGEFAGKIRAHHHGHSHTGHAHFWQHAMSRRQFVCTAAGAVVVGTALGSGLWRPGLAEAHRSHAPVPIPGGTPLLGGGFHLFGPTPDGSFDPIDAEPSTITDFNGVVGASEILGTAHGSDGKSYAFDTDMRFMQGTYIDHDGRLRNASFGFI